MLPILKLLIASIFILVPACIHAQQFDYHYNEGRALYELGEYEASIEALLLSLEDDPYRSETYVYLSTAYLATEQYQRAVEVVRKGHDNFPGHIRLYAIKAEALYWIEPSLSLPVYRELREQLQHAPAQQIAGITLEMAERSTGLVHLQLAGIEYGAGNPDGAIHSLGRAREFIADSVSVHNNLAYILIEEDRLDEAEAILDTALERFPGHSGLMLLKARISSERGDTEQAVKDLRQLHEDEPSNINRAIAYGQALLNNNQAHLANEFFLDMIERFPRERPLYRTLINMNRQRMNLSGLHAVLKLKVEQFPGDIDLAQEYARTFIVTRQFDAGHAYYDSLAAAYDDPELYRYAAHVLVYDERYEQAADYYEQIIPAAELQPVLYREYGLIMDELDKPEEALRYYELYTAVSYSGRFLVKAARLAEGSQDFLNRALATDYKPVAKLLLLDLEQASDKVDVNDLIGITNGLFDLYGDVQSAASARVETDVERREPSSPALFHSQRQLAELDEVLDMLFEYVVHRMPDEQISYYFQELLEVWPQSALLFYQQGRYYVRKNQSAEALERYMRALELGATGADIQTEVGMVWAGKQNYDQAALSFERALTYDAQYTPAYRLLIEISQKHNRLDELCDRWLSRYRNNRDNEVLREFLIEALHKADRFEQAREILQSGRQR